MKHFINDIEVTKEIFDRRAKNYPMDATTFIDECDGQETEMHLHSELECAFKHLRRLQNYGYDHAAMVKISTDQIMHVGFEQAGNLLVLYFDEGIIILSPYRNLQKFYK